MRERVEKSYPVVEAGTVNRLARREPGRLIAESEEYYSSQLERIASSVEAGREKPTILFLSGPSASGKTTTAHRLRDLFQAKGHASSVVSLDDFYLDRGSAPKDEEGRPDFETIHALDVPLLQECIRQLAREGKTVLPRFDFFQKRRIALDRQVALEPGDVLIIEGIHGLNPMLTEQVPPDSFRRVYVSARTRFVDRYGNVLLNPVDLRLMRRMVRDFRDRNASPAETLDMWDRVCQGEYRYIRPYKSLADFEVDSAMAYEPCIFHQDLAPLLGHPELDGEGQAKLQYLYSILYLFYDIDDRSSIPRSSVVREFIGTGDLRGENDRDLF